MKTYIFSHIIFIVLFGGLLFTVPQKATEVTTDYEEDPEPFLDMIGEEVYYNDYNSLYTLTRVENANDLFRYFQDEKNERAIIESIPLNDSINYTIVWREKTDKYYFSPCKRLKK